MYEAFHMDTKSHPTSTGVKKDLVNHKLNMNQYIDLLMSNHNETQCTLSIRTI